MNRRLRLSQVFTGNTRCHGLHAKVRPQLLLFKAAHVVLLMQPYWSTVYGLLGRAAVTCANVVHVLTATDVLLAML